MRKIDVSGYARIPQSGFADGNTRQVINVSISDYQTSRKMLCAVRAGGSMVSISR
jgi:hypothetical protein